MLSSAAGHQDGILEFARMPSIEEFRGNIFGLRPMVVRGGVKDWAAVNRWTFDYMRQKAGQSVVPVEVGGTYLDASMEKIDMPFASFLDYLESAGDAVPPPNHMAYVAQAPLPALTKDTVDMILPSICKSGHEDIYATMMWIGPSGTVSPLHRDPYHNAYAQVRGSKRIQLYHPRYEKVMYARGPPQTNSSQVNAEAPDMSKFPLFPVAAKETVELKAGDMLYIPCRWWHHVRSVESSINVSVWWL